MIAPFTIAAAASRRAAMEMAAERYPTCTALTVYAGVIAEAWALEIPLTEVIIGDAAAAVAWREMAGWDAAQRETLGADFCSWINSEAWFEERRGRAVNLVRAEMIGDPK